MSKSILVAAEPSAWEDENGGLHREVTDERRYSPLYSESSVLSEQNDKTNDKSNDNTQHGSICNIIAHYFSITRK